MMCLVFCIVLYLFIGLCLSVLLFVSVVFILNLGLLYVCDWRCLFAPCSEGCCLVWGVELPLHFVALHPSLLGVPLSNYVYSSKFSRNELNVLYRLQLDVALRWHLTLLQLISDSFVARNTSYSLPFEIF